MANKHLWFVTIINICLQMVSSQESYAQYEQNPMDVNASSSDYYGDFKSDYTEDLSLPSNFTDLGTNGTETKVLEVSEEQISSEEIINPDEKNNSTDFNSDQLTNSTSNANKTEQADSTSNANETESPVTSKPELTSETINYDNDATSTPSSNTGSEKPSIPSIDDTFKPKINDTFTFIPNPNATISVFSPSILNAIDKALDKKPVIQTPERPASSFGQVSSPFFFLCHHPRHGEVSAEHSTPSKTHKRLDSPHEPVTVTVSVLGRSNLDYGYKPNEGYEIGVTSSVAVDGFLITAVQALTDEHARVLAAPISPQGSTTDGKVCSVLHSQSSRKPQRDQTFLWIAPPKGSGCVAFLATGSVNENIIYKDINIFEICEEESESARLESLNILPSGHQPQENLIFRDDFNADGNTINEKIWSNIHGGRIQSTEGTSSGAGLVMNSGPISYAETVATDLSEANIIHFSLSSGPCVEDGSIGVFVGRIATVDNAIGTPQPDSKMKPDESGYSTPSESENSTEQQPNSDNTCTDYELIEEILITSDVAEHSVILPIKNRTPQSCIKFQTLGSTELEVSSETELKCLVLDDFAVLSEEVSKLGISEDFDSFAASNWLFFNGANIEKSCASDSRSLVFSGNTANGNAMTSAPVSLASDVPKQDVVLIQDFQETLQEGWNVTGGSSKLCSGKNSLVMDGDGVRKLCSSVTDLRESGSLKLTLSNGCKEDASLSDVLEYSTQLDIFLEKGVLRDSIRSISLNGLKKNEMKEFTIDLPAAILEEDSRVCVEQNDIGVTGKKIWVVTKMILTTHMPSTPEYYFQGRLNLDCSSSTPNHFFSREPSEHPVEVVVESSTDGGIHWRPLHELCLPGECPASSQSLPSVVPPSYHGGWFTVTSPIPYHGLSPQTSLRVRQIAGGAVWAVDDVFVGRCPQGCNGRGLCLDGAKCRCEFGYSGESCDVPLQENPRYLAEPFTVPVEESANLFEVWGGTRGHQCGLIGDSGAAAVFRGWGKRELTTIDVNTTDSSRLEFHYFGGTTSDIGKCPGADKPSEAVYINYSCNGGVTWSLLEHLIPDNHHDASHQSLLLPLSSKQESCRFKFSQPEHSGPDKDMWAVDDITIASDTLNNIELEFDDLAEANTSLRFHLGTIGSSCNRSNVLVFSESSNDAMSLPNTPVIRKRMLETRSLNLGPSFMMQFQLVIGCLQIRDLHPLEEEERTIESVVMLEYSLDHGLTWQLVQKPCSPATPGCQSHFTRGTVYHLTEFNNWKRVTLRLPRHTWSSATRLRLREGSIDSNGIPQPQASNVRQIEWAVDNLYIGHQCNGLCSGHGRCTKNGCVCDENFHSHECIPVHKLHRSIKADFDDEDLEAPESTSRYFVPQDDLTRYGITLIGGQVVEGSQGCGTVGSEKNLYFGANGVRQLETDDIAVADLYSMQFEVTIGGNNGVFRGTGPIQTRNCYMGESKGNSDMSEGSVVVQYSTDGGLEWNLLQELVPKLYRSPKILLPVELLLSISGVVRFRIWQPKHSSGDQWAIDNLMILPDELSRNIQSDVGEGELQISPWLILTGHSRGEYCPDEEKIEIDEVDTNDNNNNTDAEIIKEKPQDSDENNSSSALILNGREISRHAVTKPLNLTEGDAIYFQIHLGCSGSSSPVAEPVHLEFSDDGGLTWSLVVPACPPSALKCTPPSLPSIYRPQVHKLWHQVMVDVDHRLSMGPIQLRWRQENPTGGHTGEFSLKSLYVGPPCPRHCSGHGLCTGNNVCKCHQKYRGKFCEKRDNPRSSYMRDDPSVYIESTSGKVPSRGNRDYGRSPWFFLEGGSIVKDGCGPKLSDGMVILFSENSPRLAITKEVDTRNVRSLQFNLLIGSSGAYGHCKVAISPRDNVLVEFSSDAGLHWNLLSEIKPSESHNRTRPFSIYLPPKARSRQTMFRWIQLDPLMLGDDIERPDGSQPVIKRDLGLGGNQDTNTMAEWQLGDVMLMENETVPYSLSSNAGQLDEREPTSTWFKVRGGSPVEESCHGNDSLIVFNGRGDTQYAETWDVEATAATMIQFDLYGPCSTDSSPHTPPSIAVEFSIDGGNTWNLVKKQCSPPDTSCTYYDLESVYSPFPVVEDVDLTPEKRRIMMELPRSVSGSRLRTRFIRQPSEDSTGEWSIGNVFIGDSCPWMCSGHGYCDGNGDCSCDPGYFGDICVPASVLPCEVIETFNQPTEGGRSSNSSSKDSTTDQRIWWRTRGFKIGKTCGPLVAESALVFAEKGVREAITVDLDMTSGQFIQFTLMLGCDDQMNTLDSNRWFDSQPQSPKQFDHKSRNQDHLSPSAREEGILVQYSNNGGITWELLKEIHYSPYSDPKFISINLENFPKAQTNATRFRFWQPSHPQKYGSKSWAIDNLYIGGSPLAPNVLYEDFNGAEPINDAWIDWPGATMGQLCERFEIRNSLVFKDEVTSPSSERSLYSKDVSIYGDSVLQFDIKIGCDNTSNSESLHNISLQYSTGYGSSWKSVRDLVTQLDDQPKEQNVKLDRNQRYSYQNGEDQYSSTRSAPSGSKLERVSPDCLHELQTPSVYYWNSAHEWRREIIPLSKLHICGDVRFRWIEHGNEVDPSWLAWGIDNVYIGPSCILNCNGHGHCINGDTCICDEGYDGENSCLPDSPNPSTVKISFDEMTAAILRVSGGVISTKCPVIESSSLMFSEDGERALTLKDLDMTMGSVVQFYLRLGCNPQEIPDSEVQPILLQFSSDGGVTWVLISELTKDVKRLKGTEHASHFTIPLPDDARSNATQLRWWQPSIDGSFRSSWAIDEIYIGSSSEALDDFNPPKIGSWLLSPGGAMDTSCNTNSPALTFKGDEGVRFTESPDLVGSYDSYLQVLLSMSCEANNRNCYQISIEYSIDHGQNWKLWDLPSPPFPHHNSMEDLPPRWTEIYFSSDIYEKEELITLPLPPLAISRNFRMRIIQHSPPGNMAKSWALPFVYFGKSCPERCNSRGLCVEGVCQCMTGWSGTTCNVTLSPLPRYLVEEFEGTPLSESIWRKVIGGSASENCKAGGVGKSLLFDETCSRYLETVEMDLTDSHYIQFNIVSGCNKNGAYNEQTGLEYSQSFDDSDIGQEYNSQYNPYANAYSNAYQEPNLGTGNSYLSGQLIRSKRRTQQYQDIGRLEFDRQAVEIEKNGKVDSKLIVQVSCDSGTSWTTLKSYDLSRFRFSKYVWLEIPDEVACYGARVRWWQASESEEQFITRKSVNLPRLTSFNNVQRTNYALDSLVIGGSRSGPPEKLVSHFINDFTAPDWIRFYNVKAGSYCGNYKDSVTALSTESEPAVAQTSDVKITGNASLHFEIAIGCDAAWDTDLPPISVEYSTDFGYNWNLVRETCLPGDFRCHQLTDSSIFYGPLTWLRIVYPLEHIGPAKYVRFRWHQPPTNEGGDLHRWSIRNVYIGEACPHHCLGRGYCMDGKCHCDSQYGGTHCQILLSDNVPYIRDTFSSQSFLPHWAHIEGGLQSEGCGAVHEEPPAVSFQGIHTRSLTSVPVDTRSAKFVLFTGLIGGARKFSDGHCSPASSRMHNVFLQYSVDGGINWQLLRELDYNRYQIPTEDYVLMPPNARSPATLFRFWQPRQYPVAPAWSLDNVFIGGSEISADQMIESFDQEQPKWLFAPHSTRHHNYCHSNDTNALVWEQDKPGTRSITSQELIVTATHVLQFKISIGCDSTVKCSSQTPNVKLEYSKDGGSSPWRLLYEPCLPSGSRDPDCSPYIYHESSEFTPDVYNTWTRVTIPLPPKTWSSTTQLRWVQYSLDGERPLPWSLASIYVGEDCPDHCSGRGDCLEGVCHCDKGFHGTNCEHRPSPHTPSLPISMVDGFDGSLDSLWSRVLGGWTGRGCQSMAPFGTGKHLYFGGCGTRSAVTNLLDTRQAGRIIFILKIGGSDSAVGCSLSPSPGLSSLDKGVVLQYSSDMGITWHTINSHEPHEYRRARRVVYSLPPGARKYGVQLKWWQPVHGDTADQWALDNVEIDASGAKDTSDFGVLHEQEFF